MHHKLEIATSGQGLYELTDSVRNLLHQHSASKTGWCHLFVQHTSCSLLIQENADPSAKHDLECWLNRLVPENDPLYTHIYEGADDMPAHIKSMLTASTLTIPYENNRLLIGTWQGIYLWEHRHSSHLRNIIVGFC